MEGNLQLDEALYESQKYMDNYEWDKALPILEKMVKKVEELEPYKDDDYTEYHSFHEKLEGLLYEEFEKPMKEVCNISDPISDLYLAYGSALLGLEQKEESKEALLTALHWNPVHPAIHLQLADWERYYGEAEGVIKCASEAMKWAFHMKDIGNCYYYFGWYTYRKGAYAAALGYYHLCSDLGDGWRKLFSDSDQMMIVIQGKAEPPTLEEMEKYSIQYNVPLACNSKIVDFVLKMGDEAMADYEPRTAYYFYSILYEMTGSENVRKALDVLEEDHGIVPDVDM